MVFLMLLLMSNTYYMYKFDVRYWDHNLIIDLYYDVLHLILLSIVLYMSKSYLYLILYIYFQMFFVNYIILLHHNYLFLVALYYLTYHILSVVVVDILLPYCKYNIIPIYINGSQRKINNRIIV